MAFYDIDLKDQVAGNHELWTIEEIIGFSKIMYRFKGFENKVGRSGFGIDVGIRCLYLQFHYDLSDQEGFDFLERVCFFTNQRIK